MQAQTAAPYRKQSLQGCMFRKGRSPTLRPKLFTIQSALSAQLDSYSLCHWVDKSLIKCKRCVCMYMCVHVCVHVCGHVCMCVHMHVCTHMCMYMSACEFVGMYLLVCICTCMYICL